MKESSSESLDVNIVFWQVDITCESHITSVYALKSNCVLLWPFGCQLRLFWKTMKLKLKRQIVALETTLELSMIFVFLVLGKKISMVSALVTLVGDSTQEHNKEMVWLRKRLHIYIWKENLQKVITYCTISNLVLNFLILSIYFQTFG